MCTKDPNHRFTHDQILSKLREIEASLAQFTQYTENQLIVLHSLQELPQSIISRLIIEMKLSTDETKTLSDQLLTYFTKNQPLFDFMLKNTQKIKKLFSALLLIGILKLSEIENYLLDDFFTENILIKLPSLCPPESMLILRSIITE